MIAYVRRAVADRILLLRALRRAGPALIVTISALAVLGSLVPAATALAVAFLVGRVEAATADSVLSASVLPLGLFAGVLIAGQLMEAVRSPLSGLAKARIDGAHRRHIIVLTTGGSALDALESPLVQQLIREAKADPDNWTQRTPAEGALAQLGLLGSLVGLMGSFAVLASYSWWLVVMLAVPLLVARMLDTAGERAGYRTWLRGSGEGVHAGKWKQAIVSPGEGKEARVFGLGDWVVARMQHHIGAMFEPVWAVHRRNMALRWRQALLVAVPVGIAFAMVADSAASGFTSVAVVTAVLSAGASLHMILDPFSDPSIIGGVACLRATQQLRVELGGAEPQASEPARAAPSIPPSAPLVRFEAVSFTYPRTGRVVLQHVDLEIRPGELLAIVGLNGAGKSTLIKLLAGLYTPSSGRITADGVDLTRLGIPDWRSRIAVVFQDFVRYHLSAEDNVVLGRPDRDPAALDAAASDAGLDELIARLPDGWRTPLARSRTGGVDLSGGQWQQVVLARALYAVRTGARLLVLDEPTAHLDVRTEFDVFERLAAHKGDASVVLISHRLSTVRRADRIVLLEHGRIAESGTHDELMTLGGSYAEMFQIQADRFQRGFDDRIEEGELL